MKLGKFRRDLDDYTNDRIFSWKNKNQSLPSLLTSFKVINRLSIAQQDVKTKGADFDT